MKKKSDQPRVLLSGDSCSDNYLYTHSGKDHKDIHEIRLNWQFSRRTNIFKKPGGVLLISHFLKNINHSLFYVGNSKKDPDSSLQSYVILRKYNDQLRIQEFLGLQKSRRPEKISFPQPFDGYEIICIDDLNNGFSETSESIDYYDKIKYDHCTVFYLLSRPIFNKRNMLLKLMMEKNPERTYFILNAHDLRDQNIGISGRLSWEMAINDVVIKFNTTIKSEFPFFTPSIIIVRIGLEGVLVLQHDHTENMFIPYRLYYFPGFSEGHFEKETPGSVQGIASLFVAQLIHNLTQKPTESALDFLHSSIPSAMGSCITFVRSGYNFEVGNFKIPDLQDLKNVGLIKDISGKMVLPVRSIAVPDFEFLRQNKENWSILEEETANNTNFDIACEYVTTGNSDALAGIPIVDYGGMRLIDRLEIEKFRSIKNLIEEYLNNHGNRKPLNIAVFGPPGSGKSFGVKQIARAVLGKDSPVLEYNLSQLKSHDELIDAFHCIRDYTIVNKSPLVFFDEFDTTYQGSLLGWLRFFLAPMQDGEFLDRGMKHPLGKAIFVFAGGTCHSFRQFSKGEKLTNEDFRLAKGPDFTSRLKGYVDIAGVNPVDLSDDLYIIRRAIIFRKTFEQDYASLIDLDGKLHIDSSLLKALLMIPEYYHDSRSLKALLEMSMILGKSSFDISSLPTSSQMDIHVNSNFFQNILHSSENLVPYLPEIAKALHDDYLSQKPSKQASEAWDHLNEYYKTENIKLAKDIPLKLFRLGLIVTRDPVSKEDHKLTDVEIEILAKWEHKRWNKSKIADGWKYDPVRNDGRKLHDRLLPWKSLDENARDLDRNAVRIIPEILKKTGWAIKKIS